MNNMMEALAKAVMVREGMRTYDIEQDKVTQWATINEAKRAVRVRCFGKGTKENPAPVKVCVTGKGMIEAARKLVELRKAKTKAKEEKEEKEESASC